MSIFSFCFYNIFEEDCGSLTQNMQERQTQVRALPARAEGSDRETEGMPFFFFKASKKKLSKLTARIHNVPRNSLRFHTNPASTDPCRPFEMHRGVTSPVLFGFTCECPPLVLQLTSALQTFFSPSVVTLFHFWGGRRWVLTFTFLSKNSPSPQMILVSPSSPLPSLCTHMHIQTLFTDQPSTPPTPHL